MDVENIANGNHKYHVDCLSHHLLERVLECFVQPKVRAVGYLAVV